MTKVILILCDALRDDIAAEEMGYLEMMIEQKRGSRFHMTGGLPSLSRPCYETIHTGMPASDHGITSNAVQRRSTAASIFSVAHAEGKITAAAAYCWYSELYVRTPFNPLTDKEIDDESAFIQHGRFYFQDDYPDQELFAQAAWLSARFAPDYLLLHPMGIDHMGHLHGGGSSEYRNQVVLQDQLIAYAVPAWLAAGYTVIVTGDHGMNSHKNHNGTYPDVRHVPFYVLPATGDGLGNTGERVSQLAVAPTLCALLGIAPAPTMTVPPITVQAM